MESCKNLIGHSCWPRAQRRWATEKTKNALVEVYTRTHTTYLYTHALRYPQRINPRCDTRIFPIMRRDSSGPPWHLNAVVRAAYAAERATEKHTLLVLAQTKTAGECSGGMDSSARHTHPDFKAFCYSSLPCPWEKRPNLFIKACSSTRHKKILQ